MKMKLIWLLPLFLLAFGAATYFSQYVWGGIFLILSWLVLSLWVRRFEFGRSFSYPLLVGAALTSSMYFPFIYLKTPYLSFASDCSMSVQWLDSMKLITPILQVIMFGMGTQLTLGDFRQILKQPWGVLIGMTCQYCIMPTVGYTLAMLFGFDKEIAVGLILIGSVPGGIASNVMCFIARANVALSITLTAISTLLAPVVTPAIMQYLAGQMIEIDFLKMMLGIMDIVIFPIMAGLIFQALQTRRFWCRSSLVLIFVLSLITTVFFSVLYQIEYFNQEAYLLRLKTTLSVFILLPIFLSLSLRHWIRRNPDRFSSILGIISMFGLLLTIVIINAAGRDHLLKIGHLLIMACLCHNIIGYLTGYGIAKLCRMDEQSCRTISLEVGLQNGGLASGLAVTMGKAATVGLAPAIFGPLMNVTGSCIATLWRGFVPKDQQTSKDSESESDSQSA